jgi:hypothetical protein
MPAVGTTAYGKEGGGMKKLLSVVKAFLKNIFKDSELDGYEWAIRCLRDGTHTVEGLERVSSGYGLGMTGFDFGVRRATADYKKGGIV